MPTALETFSRALPDERGRRSRAIVSEVTCADDADRLPRRLRRASRPGPGAPRDLEADAVDALVELRAQRADRRRARRRGATTIVNGLPVRRVDARREISSGVTGWPATTTISSPALQPGRGGRAARRSTRVDRAGRRVEPSMKSADEDDDRDERCSSRGPARDHGDPLPGRLPPVRVGRERRRRAPGACGCLPRSRPRAPAAARARPPRRRARARRRARRAARERLPAPRASGSCAGRPAPAGASRGSSRSRRAGTPRCRTRPRPASS